MSELNTHEVALTHVARTGVALRKILSELEETCNTGTAQSRVDWTFKSVIAATKFISAFGVFHTLALGDDIPTLSPHEYDTPDDSDHTGVPETIIRAKRPATVADLEKSLAESYELDEATAKAQAEDLSSRLSKCLYKTMSAVKSILKLQEPTFSAVNGERLNWAFSLDEITQDIESFATEGSMAYPTELYDTDGLLAPSEELQAELERLKAFFADRE